VSVVPDQVKRVQVGGSEVLLGPAPWCDCDRRVMGFTRNSEGAWVKPCCGRPAREFYLVHMV